MFLYDVFRPECIKIGLESEDKEEVFEELVDHYCQREGSEAREDILDALRKREAKMSTGIHKGIALPHGKSDAVSGIKGVLGISRKGINYDALDGQPVYILFMLLAPEKDSEIHLRLLKRLAGLLDDPQFYTDMIAQTSPTGANGVIKKYEDIVLASD
ncbi:MAG: PTS sugar transporter subunit IIA [Treponema sp.]|jgi:PTS system fructose-specific IIC component/PTS system nitrogen regulatory IIA component|nr:PTS sugar transporter subunit IIA [Treponema sp.]